MPSADTTAGRRRVPPAAGDLALAGLVVLLLGATQLLTPAFTDYEAEAEPAIQLLLDGAWRDGLAALPVYGGAVLLQMPAAFLADLLGGGFIAVFRAVAVPGAIGVAVLAALVGRWLRRAGRSRRDQLLGVAITAASPAVSAAWYYGHVEEPLVAALALGGLVVAGRAAGVRGWLAGGLLLGLAAAGKPSAVLAIPVALALAPTLRAAATVAGGAALGGAALIGPVLAAQFGKITTGLQAGGSDIFSVGNLWWFFGEPNPDWADPREAGVRVGATLANSARLNPGVIGDHAHEGIVVAGAVLAALWWWRRARPARARGGALLASALWLAAALFWWRALLDPWFQPYYLTPALLAAFLADARGGRWPLAAAAAWAGMWLTHTPDALLADLRPDPLSAVSLAWTVPFGSYLVWRALRPPAVATRQAPPQPAGEVAAHA